MDSSASDADLLFEEDQVSSSVSAVDAPNFLKEYGVFYQANAEIGKIVTQLGDEGVSWDPSGLRRFLPILQSDPVALYMCSAGSELEIFGRSQYLPSAGVKGANGMYEVPYVFLTVVKKLKETEVRMKEGGVMIVHPRFSLGSTSGRAIGYGLPEKNYKFKRTTQLQEQHGKAFQG
ncbi:hypothetical protein DL764_010188 [Monosporascus ibericus]|uniref:Uncharacterized protein n=1 Tax=Monosporascus ibericus TaxID=155417 RepID=A0A4V1X8R9_9PEZI|nr:hypothetical protein DL764_010188 [Monosporascus ibericus]